MLDFYYIAGIKLFDVTSVLGIPRSILYLYWIR